MRLFGRNKPKLPRSPGRTRRAVNASKAGARKVAVATSAGAKRARKASQDWLQRQYKTARSRYARRTRRYAARIVVTLSVLFMTLIAGVGMATLLAIGALLVIPGGLCLAVWALVDEVWTLAKD